MATNFCRSSLLTPIAQASGLIGGYGGDLDVCGGVWSNFAVSATAELCSNFFGWDFTIGIVAPLDGLYKSAAKK